MTRILAILLLCLIPVIANLGGDREKPIQLGGESDLGEGYAYESETLRRFRELLESEGWSLADPSRNPQGMLEAVHEKSGLIFVLIPSGVFPMGLAQFPHMHCAFPDHVVAVPALLLSKTECTQLAWDQIGESDARTWKGENLPIEGVTWIAASRWCEALGLRLPSEAEWEYTCRAERWKEHAASEAIASQARYGEKPRLESVAWFCLNSGDLIRAESDYDPEYVKVGGKWGCRSHPVAAKSPNAWGLFDMLGNVYELCQDHYHDTYHGAPGDGSAWEEELVEGHRVWRGGSWHSPLSRLDPTFRDASSVHRSRPWLGFRPAADLPK